MKNLLNIYLILTVLILSVISETTFSQSSDTLIAKIYFERAKNFSALYGKYLVYSDNSISSSYYDSSISYYGLSRELFLKINDWENYLRSTVGLVFLLQKKDYKSSISLLNESIKKVENNCSENPYYIELAYLRLGILYAQEGDYNKAFEYIKKSLKLRLQKYGENNANVVSIYNVLSKLYYDSGDFENAIFYYKKKLESVKITRIENAGRYYQLISLCHIWLNNYDEGLKYLDSARISVFNEALFSTNIGSFSGFDKILEGVSALTDAYKSAYQKEINPEYYENALKSYKISMEVLDYANVNLKVEDLKYDFKEQTYKLFDEALNVACELSNILHSKNYIQEGFFFSEKSKASILMSSISKLKAEQYTGIPDSLLKTEERLKRESSFISDSIQKHVKLSASHVAPKELAKKREKLNLLYAKLIRHLETNYPKYYQLKYDTKTITPEEIQKLLPDNEAMIEYFVGSDFLRIFVIDRNNFNVVSVPIDSGFFSIADSYYNLLQKKANLVKRKYKREFFQKSTLLYNYLIAPVEKYISGKESLMIIPAGILSYIPFETLIKKDDNTLYFSSKDYLVRRFAIHYNYSATLASISGNKSSNSNCFTGFAPKFNFDKSHNIKVPELSYTEKEVKTIASLFRQKGFQSNVYTNEDATENKLKEVAPQRCGFLHIATHSLVNQKNPNLTGLLFYSQNKDSLDEGILFADEIYNLKVNADLVVLSSCESGIGKYINGEGMLALTRGFIYSGVSNLLFSLWEVSDKQTYKLMTGFYKNVLDGQNYTRALRNSKLKMLENESTAIPDSWSTFILMTGFEQNPN